AFLQVAGADLDAVVRELHRSAAAGGHLRRAAVEHFVLRDDVDRIEILVAARHRLLEEQRAVEIVDAVVDERRELARLDYDFAAEAVAYFEANLVAVENDRMARQAIQAGGAVALQLVLHVALLGFGGECAVTEVLARVIGLQTGERTAVARELGQRQTRFEIAEQRGELATLQLHEQLARSRGFEALLGRIAVERVEAIRLDHAQQFVLRLLVIARRVVRGGQQVLAFDRAFREERNATVARVALFQAGIGCRLHVVADRAIGRSVFSEADEDPVARLRLQPHADFLLPTLAEAQAQ